MDTMTFTVEKRIVVAVVALVIAATAGVWIWAPGHARVSPARGSATGEIALECSDSVGQQGPGGYRIVGGVTGLVLPGSNNPGALTPIFASGGRKYFVYKAFLAVASSDAPFATVSIIAPASARLYYGSPLAAGPTLVTASRRRVRLPVCGPRFSGFVGGVVLEAPTRVTFEVSSPNRQPVRVDIPIGTG
jgi:hypothetical protein